MNLLHITGAVFQIGPDYPNKAFAASFFIVSEVKSWGVMGYVQALGVDKDTTGGQAYLRISNEDVEKYMSYIGPAQWVVG